jgi:hypothetical protein
MSNTGQLEKRIEGQLKMLEIAGRRIGDLEAQVENQANKLRKIRDTVSMFNNGIQILSCDGNVVLTMSEYNALVQAINEGVE